MKLRTTPLEERKEKKRFFEYIRKADIDYLLNLILGACIGVFPGILYAIYGGFDIIIAIPIIAVTISMILSIQKRLDGIMLILGQILGIFLSILIPFFK